MATHFRSLLLLIVLYSVALQELFGAPSHHNASLHKSCYEEILGNESPNEKQVHDAWANETTGIELSKCVLTEQGAINSTGVNTEKIVDVIKKDLKATYSQALSKIGDELKKCTEGGVKLSDVDAIIRCVYLACRVVYPGHTD